MGMIGEITSRLIVGPAEMVGEFEEPGLAHAAKANLDVFLKWAFEAPEDAKTAPPAVALIINQSKLDPSEDRPRRSDWGGRPPEIRIEGALLIVDAPRSKNARDVVRKVLVNAHVKKMFDRPKAGGGGTRAGPVIAAALALAAVLAAAAAAYFLFRG